MYAANSSELDGDVENKIYYLLKKNPSEIDKIIKYLHRSGDIVADVLRNERYIHFPIILSGSLTEGFPLDGKDKYHTDLLCPLPELNISWLNLKENFHHHPEAPAYLNITIPKEQVYSYLEVLPKKQMIIKCDHGQYFLTSKNMWESLDVYIHSLFNSLYFTTQIFSRMKNSASFQLRLIFDTKFKESAIHNRKVLQTLLLDKMKHSKSEKILSKETIEEVLHNIEKCKDEFLDINFIPVIKCTGKWPPKAKPWIKRQRYWPSKKVVDEIVSQGFHILFESCEEYQNMLLFSAAELLLFKNLSSLQSHVFYLWKAIYYGYLKDTKLYETKDENKLILDKKSWKPGNLITSYHIKTTFFWFIEESSPNIWEMSNALERSMIILLQKLLKCVKEKYLPHYFIPEHNLFYCGKEEIRDICFITQKTTKKIEYFLDLIQNEGSEAKWSSVLDNINVTVSNKNINKITIYIFILLLLNSRNGDGKIIKTTDEWAIWLQKLFKKIF